MNKGRERLLDTAATSLGILAIAVTSATEVVLFLHRFGTSERTDGVFAAFALYALGTVFAQILRTSAVPLITGEAAPSRSADFGVAVAALAALIAVAGVVGANAVATTLGRSLQPDGRALAAGSVRLLAPAMALQLVAAAMAVVGARRGRVRAVGWAYVIANIGGLVAFLIATPLTDERSLAWCVLIGSALLIPCLLPATGTRIVVPTGVRAVVSAGMLAIRSALVPLGFVALYPLTIALAGDVSPGTITRFAFVFTMCSYLPGLTSVSISMSDVVHLSESPIGAEVTRAEIARRSARWSALAIAPVVAVAATIGPYLFTRVEGSVGDAGDISRLFLLVGPWLAATVLLWSTLPALLAMTRGEGLLRYVPLIIAVHIAATLGGRAVSGFDGVVASMCLAPLLFAGLSWRLTGVARAARAVTTDVVATVGLAIVAFAPPTYVADAIGEPRLGSRTAAAAAGLLVYVLLLRVAFPAELRGAQRFFTGSRNRAGPAVTR